MTKPDVVQQLSKAAGDGTLLTKKHDPNNLAVTEAGYRTVLSFELAASLEEFFKSGGYAITQFNNLRFPNSPLYLQITPQAGSTFSVPGSGVPAHSSNPSAALDCLVAVSGQNQGLHIFAENSALISANTALQFVANLT